LIEDAYRLGEAMGLSVWCADQAGPFQTVPQPGPSWQPECEPARQPHEYLRDGTAKVLTLFHPADGRVRLEGATSCPNAVLHPWLRRELSAILEGLPSPPASADVAPAGAADVAPAGAADVAPAGAADVAPPASADVATRVAWERWQDGLTVKPTLPPELPPMRMLLVLDNLAGHKTAAFVCWLFAHGIMPLYTPLGGSWLNMAESIQRILKRRALGGQHPERPEQIIGWFEAVARHWNADPTPFRWGGKRMERRRRQRERSHRVGGSGACTRGPIRRRSRTPYGHQRGK
jgi:hypothetical protein